MPDLTVDEVNEFLAHAYPAAHASGIRCEEVSKGVAVARMMFDDSQLRPGAYISGPSIFSTADCALWFATFTLIGIEAMAVTSEMSIRFLRPAQDGDLLARAVVNSSGARRLVGTIEVWVDGRPDRVVAVAQGTYARP